MKSTRHQVPASESGVDLLSFVASRLNLSRRQAKEILDQRNVLVNGSRIWMARHPLRVGDEVEVLRSEVLRPATDPVSVLWRDPFLLVVDKPAGILSDGQRSMEERLRQALNIPSLLAVHRLDRDTSGCLIYAVNDEAKQRMIPLFRNRQIVKTYHAIVSGRVSGKPDVIRTPVEGQEAVTHLRVLDASAAASHLTLKIDTGRTHQIREHMLHIGHPVVGDRSYSVSKRIPEALRGVPRQMLHASGLGFRHPLTGQTIHAEAPLPQDFRECLQMLRLR